ncbi:MAG TPA: CBS domain-containing protein [Xanthobacteraceae bacterium]|nr:CBS domain-containing protein [Xanthobacteraceae bacterium]
MKAADIMSGRVISVAPDASITECVRLMLQHRISGLPVIDGAGRLVGVVTEGDFLRRVEAGTERRRPRWLQFIAGPGRLADEYVHSHGRKVSEVMTREPVTVNEDTPVEDLVRVMEQRRIKRLPVMRGSRVVGIVSRANLLHALASVASAAAPVAKDDRAIRQRVLAELAKQPWAPRDLIDVTVRDGTVELWGVVTVDHQRQAAVVAAENVPGVKKVANHLSWMEPISGMVVYEPAAEAEPKTAA